MIGQDRLLRKIEYLPLDGLPHSLIIIGDKGSGRHTIINKLVNKLNLPHFDITENITLEIIEEIYTKVEPIVYFIELDNISIKNENMLLKLIEEPLNNAYIILFSSNKNYIIPTILNRCQVWELNRYTDEQLRYFLTTIKDDYPNYFYLVNIFKTPGQLLIAIENKSIQDMLKLCTLFVDHIGSANFSNSLTISNKIAFNKEQDKWDFDIFIKVLIYIVKLRVVESYCDQVYNLYIATEDLIKNSNIAHINKQHLFENYLAQSRCIMNGYKRA